MKSKMRNAGVAVAVGFALTACVDDVKSSVSASDHIRWQTIKETPGGYTVAIDKDYKQGCRALGCIASDYEGKVQVNVSGNNEGKLAAPYSFVFTASVSCLGDKKRTLWQERAYGGIGFENRSFSAKEEKQALAQAPEMFGIAHEAVVDHFCKDVKNRPDRANPLAAIKF